MNVYYVKGILNFVLAVLQALNVVNALEIGIPLLIKSLVYANLAIMKILIRLASYAHFLTVINALQLMFALNVMILIIG